MRVSRKAQERLRKRNEKKFTFKDIPEEKTQKILNSDLTDLRQMLLNREVTSEDLVNVFGKQCYTIGRKLNLVTEEYYDLALIIAKEKDKELEEAIKHKRTNELGLFHGIPISIKDHINEKEKLCTIGSPHLSNNVAKSDALAV